MLTEKDSSDYFRKSFASADGLWFVKVEEKRGFNEALEIDSEVWKVMPKIQARFLKERLGCAAGMDSLCLCLEEKFRLEGYLYSLKKEEKRIEFSISDCPWHEKMIQAKREKLSSLVGQRICSCEYAAWANEFGSRIRFEFLSRLCAGEESCTLAFFLA